MAANTEPQARGRAVPGFEIRRWAFAVAVVLPIVVVGMIVTYWLGNPTFLGLDAYRWSAAVILATGLGIFAIRSVRNKALIPRE